MCFKNITSISKVIANLENLICLASEVHVSPTRLRSLQFLFDSLIVSRARELGLLTKSLLILIRCKMQIPCPEFVINSESSSESCTVCKIMCEV